MGERVPMMRGMPMNEGGLQKLSEVILGTSSMLVRTSTHHQNIAYYSWSLIQKFWMFFSQVMKEHSHPSKEILWLANIHPKT